MEYDYEKDLRGDNDNSGRHPASAVILISFYILVAVAIGVLILVVAFK